jgi:hypothetical protein
VLRSGYFPACFLCVVIILNIVLYCTFRIIRFLSFYTYIFGEQINSYFVFGFGFQPEQGQAGIYLLFYTWCWLVFYVFRVLQALYVGFIVW